MDECPYPECALFKSIVFTNHLRQQKSLELNAQIEEYVVFFLNAPSSVDRVLKFLVEVSKKNCNYHAAIQALALCALRGQDDVKKKVFSFLPEVRCFNLA